MIRKRVISEYTFLILLSSFLLFILFYKLGANYLTNWDEAWYADITRNIVRSGNIITLVWNKEPFFDKPPLYFWFSALIFKILGISEFSIRFLSAVSGFTTGVILYFLARSLFNSKVAIISLIILSSTIGFLYRTRTGNLDVFLTFWILISIFSFYQGYIKKEHKWFIAMGVSLGCAFLTKGAIAFVFPAIAIFYLYFKKDYHVLTSKLFPSGIIVGIIISVLWISVSYLTHGQEFISKFLFNQSGKLSTTPFLWEHFSFDYIQHLKSGLKIWFVFLPLACLYVLYRWRKSTLILLAIYFFIFLASLFFFENKSNWFLVPLYPLIALFIGYSVYDFTLKLIGKKYFTPVFIIVLIIALFQNVRYKSEYVVPDISKNEAQVALYAKKISKENDHVYLTNYYYPTAVYYSDRKIFAVYSEHVKNDAWWIKSKQEWDIILKKPNVIIITTVDELRQLQERYPDYTMEIVYGSGDKLLVKKI